MILMRSAMRTFTRTLKSMRMILAAVAGGGAACLAMAQIHSVLVRDEPLHQVRMETAKYRVYEVVVDQRDAMLFHEHKADNVTVFLSESEITNELDNGQKTDYVVKTGLVSFAAASTAKSYVHRVLLRGGAAFRNVTIEFLQPLSTTPPRDNVNPLDPALVPLRESPRGKAYRLALEPEQSITLPSNASDTLMVCLSEGQVTPTRDSRPGDVVNCSTGGFHLMEHSGAAVLKNDGTRRVELAVIAVY